MNNILKGIILRCNNLLANKTMMDILKKQLANIIRNSLKSGSNLKK